MMHDISHCAQDKCPKKDSCYRFLAHLEAQNKKLKYLTYYITKVMPIDGSCKVYWKCQSENDK